MTPAESWCGMCVMASCVVLAWAGYRARKWDLSRRKLLEVIPDASDSE